MKTKNRIISFVLALVMLVLSLPLTAIPVIAADGDTPEVELDYEYDEYSFTMKAQITLSGGGIEQYGFAYSINGVKTLYHWFDEEIGKYEEFSYTISVEPGDEIWYQVIVKNEYGKTAKEDDIFNVPEEEPEIELETPTIYSPDSYDDIVAGEDLKFEWDEVDGAEKYEWELYEADRWEGSYLTSGTTRNEYVTIDGDWFDGNNVYSFYVRAVCDDSYSEWDECYYLYCVLPDSISVEENDFQIGSEGGTGYIRLASTIEWEATVSKSWIVINKSSGTGNAEIQVQVDPNYGDERTGSVIIHNELGDIYVTIHQHSGITPYLTVSTNRIELSSEDSSWSFDIFSNVSWEIFCDNDWIRNISQEEGYGDECIQILVNENTSTQSRTAIITIEGDGITRTVTVTQDGRPAIVGDINNDGEITNKDRFLLNRYLANMAGYTNIDKTLADINGDGIINQADAVYLTNHLAGVKGYETFPERDAPCLHINCDAIYAGKTVFINNTIKNDGVHSYYHLWRYVCKECGEDLGEFQGDDDAVRGTSEKNVPCTYNSDGVCSCGGINTVGYDSWIAKNISDKQISVYDTPYSTDGSYGKIFVNESVKVLGSKAGRYLIEYDVTGTNTKKQGYVNANYFASASNYRIEFKFETITLPVSNRKVLLIPKDGYAAYTLYDGNTKISVDTTKLKINFEDPSACNYGATTITGKVGGFGTLSVYYIVNGIKYYLQCPDYYIVADSSAVYTSGNINAFSDEEKEYISEALDIYFSQNDIKIPYELYWSKWDNFVLCVEELDKIITSANAHANDYSAILAKFIEEYAVKPEIAAITTDEQDQMFGSIISEYASALLYIAEFEKDKLSNIQVASQLKDLLVSLEVLLEVAPTSPSHLKQLFSNLADIFNHVDFKEMVKAFPQLLKITEKGIKNGLPINMIGKRLTALVDSSKFFKVIDGVFTGLDIVGTGIDVGLQYVEFFTTVFGNWERHREFLSAMLVAIDSIPEASRANIKEYDTLRKSVVLLLDQYDENFGSRLLNAAIELQKDITVIGLKFLLGHFCPGAAAVLALAQLGAGLTNAREKADVNRMIQFYVILNEGIMINFESLYDNGKTFSSIYLSENDLVYMLLKMAICANDWTQYVSDKYYSKAEKDIFAQNIKDIESKFAIYLD